MYIGINAVIIEAFGRCNRWESWQQVVQWLGDRKTHRRRLSDRFHRSRGWEIWAIACICNLYSCINNNNYTIDFICYVIPSATPYTHTCTHKCKHTHLCTHILQLFHSVKATLLFSHEKKNQKKHSSLWFGCQLNVLWLKHLNRKPGNHFEYSAVYCVPSAEMYMHFRGRLNRKWGSKGTVLIRLLFFKLFLIFFSLSIRFQTRNHQYHAWITFAKEPASWVIKIDNIQNLLTLGRLGSWPRTSAVTCPLSFNLELLGSPAPSG